MKNIQKYTTDTLPNLLIAGRERLCVGGFFIMDTIQNNDKRKCIKCDVLRSIEEYHLQNKSTGQRKTVCKFCVKAFNKKYKPDNKEILKEKRKIYESKLPEGVLKERWSIYHKKEQAKRTPEKKEYLKSYIRQYRIDNSKRLYKRYLDKMKGDHLFEFMEKTRISIHKFINRPTLHNKKHSALGCSRVDFIKHIEGQFKDWMNWGNYSLYNGVENYGWDYDHIVPLSSARTKEELIKLFHYTNVQPLCSKVNRYIKKHNITEKSEHKRNLPPICKIPQ